MKRFLAVVAVFTLTAGFAAADEIGLTAGLEFGIEGINKPNDEDMAIYLSPGIEYENSFLDETLDIYANLAYDVYLTKTENDEGEEVNGNGLYFDFLAGYNLGIGDASTLSFLLENENYFEFAPATKDNIAGIIKPGFKFNQNLADGGDVYAQLDVPIAYMFYGAEKDNIFSGLNITVGWASGFGLGVEAAGYILLSPNDGESYNGFTGIGITVSYENGPLYAELATSIPLKDLDKGYCPYNFFDLFAGSGVSITPMVSYNIVSGLSAYVSCTIDGIGIQDNDVSVSPAIGVTYKF